MAEQLKRVSRRWLCAAFALVMIVVIGYGVLWRAGAVEMKSSVARWIEEQRAAGFEISHGQMHSAGFPFFLRIRIDGPAIASPDAWRWRGERLVLDVQPFDWNRLNFSPEGAQVLWAKGQGEWRLAAADIRAGISGDEARGWTFAMTMNNAEATRLRDGAAIAGESFVLDLAPDAADPTTLTLTLSADALERVQGEQQIGPAHINASLALSQTPWLSAADQGAAWRRAGGALRIDGLLGALEDARLFVTGAVTLDEAGYPAGTLNAQITNPAVFVRLLGEAGALTPEQTEQAAASLTLMALAGGGKIAAPIELAEGSARIGGVALAELPRFEEGVR